MITKTKSVIVYGTFKPNHAKADYIKTCDGLFVRVGKRIGDASEALKLATPLEGETVLNTMEIPE